MIGRGILKVNPMTSPDKLRVARDRVARLYRYLQTLNQHRNPEPRLLREQL